jgi:DNA-binding transcriptional MocR family regulator
MPKRHNAKLCPFAIRQRIVTALANGDSKRAIARALRVSNNTVTAIAEQEWQQVEARKGRIAAQAERAATLASDLINAKLESAKPDEIPLSTLVPVFGVAVDKLAILRGDPSLTIHHQHTHTHQHELVNNFNAAIARIEKRVTHAAVVGVPALPPRDASVAGKNGAQKES